MSVRCIENISIYIKYIFESFHKLNGHVILVWGRYGNYRRIPAKKL